MTTLAKLPPVLSGVRVTYGIAIVTPVARTNSAKNPSGETGSTGWTAAGSATISRVTTKSCYGAYSFQVTPTSASGDGIYYDDSTSFAGATTYAVSIALIGIPGQTYEISVRTTGGSSLSARQWVASGYWERIWVAHTEGIGANRRVYVTKIGTATGVFYVDGLNIEPCGSEGVFPTTYIDGDQPGLIPNEAPPAYLWTGTPHASTSIRSGQTRAGGRLRNLSEFGFTLSALIGLGLDTPEQDLVPFSILDGAQYNDTQKPPRPFSIVGRFDGAALGSLARGRGALASLLDRDLVGRRQPLTLYLTPQDECGETIGNVGRITALYTGGLSGNHTNPFAEEAAISFTTVEQSSIQGPDAGFVVTSNVTSNSADNVLRRTSAGVWGRIGSGATFNGAVYSVAEGPNGYIYAGGDFTSAPGGVAANRIAYYNPATGAWNAMGTGANNTVRTICVGGDGNVYAGGDFTDMGGVANTVRIAYWDGSWHAMGTGANGTVYTIVFGYGFGERLYAGGNFTTIGGVAANRIASWSGSGWSAMGTGANGIVYALILLHTGALIATGAFTDMGGVAAADKIGQWSAATWSALSTGLNGDGRCLAVGSDGTLYVGGDFTTAGGVTVNYIAQWNGVLWSALSGGVTTTGASPVVAALAFDPMTNRLCAFGSFQKMDNVRNMALAAYWTGAAWIFADIGLSSSDPVTSAMVQRDGSLVIGLSSIAGPLFNSPVITTVTNRGNAATYPRVTARIVNPAILFTSLQLLINNTTGAMVAFDLLFFTGETITVQFMPSQLQVTSDVRGLITGSILPGSDDAAFFLQPGENAIGVMTENSDTTVTVWWPELSLTADDLIPRLT